MFQRHQSGEWRGGPWGGRRWLRSWAASKAVGTLTAPGSEHSCSPWAVTSWLSVPSSSQTPQGTRRPGAQTPLEETAGPPWASASPPAPQGRSRGRLREGTGAGEGAGLSPEQWLGRVGGLASGSSSAPLPQPQPPSRWGEQSTSPHLPPVLTDDVDPEALPRPPGRPSVLSRLLPHPPPCPPLPASSAPTRNQPAWEKLGWEPAADSDLGTLPRLPSACPPRPAPHRPLQGNQEWGRGKALKGTRTRTWARTPGRGLGLGPQRPPGQLHPAGLGVGTGRPWACHSEPRSSAGQKACVSK